MEQEKMRTWLNYYKESLHRITEVVLFYTASGELVNWNLAAVKELGYDGEELTHLRIKDILQKEAEELVQENAAFEPPARYEQCKKEVKVYRKNETFYIGEVKWLIIADEEVYGICIIRNVQEMREVEKELVHKREEIEEANGAKTLFVANVTHELRTPLNGIKGMTALLLNSPLNGEQKENLQIMQRCIGNMEEIINELLDFSKIQAGKLQLENAPFEYRSWMEEIMEVNRFVARAKGLTLEYSGAKDIPSVLVGDSFRLRQVLNNLISNAIKFTHTGSINIEVTVMEQIEEQVRLHFSVSDTGIGIRPEEKERLFQSFSQVDPSITRRYGGTGLGLAICKALVEEMGGTIDVESVEPKGSRFYFTILVGRGKSLKVDTDDSEEETAKHLADQFKPCENMAQEEAWTFREIVEKVGFCIEMESWEKAEELAHMAKRKIENRDKALGRLVFRLELALRKRQPAQINEKYGELLGRIDESKEEGLWNKR